MYYYITHYIIYCIIYHSTHNKGEETETSFILKPTRYIFNEGKPNY